MGGEVMHAAALRTANQRLKLAGGMPVEEPK